MIKFLHKNRTYLDLFFLVIVIIIFFRYLFLDKIIITPDFGRSDILHLNYPIKSFLSESLKNHQLPLWNSHIGNGYPTLAEGQIGTFNLINLILFKFLPMPQAFNLGLISSFLIAAFGMYFYTRILKLSNITAIFSALVFSLSGFFITHIQHYNLIQTAAFLPLQLAIIEYSIKYKKSIYLITILPIFLSQQIFAGFFQIAVYSLIFIIFYTILRLFILKESKIQVANFYIFLLFGIVLGIGISAIQLIPTIEFIRQSSRLGGLPIEEIYRFPYKLRDVAMFIHPFLFGNPRFGNYPPYDNNWGIFWENNAYLGILPLLLIIISPILFKKSSLHLKKITIIFVTIAVFSLLLSFGSGSPFHILYAFPPFNYFRVPSRFLLIVLFSLTIIAALNFQWLESKFSKKSAVKSFVTIFILVLTIVNIFYIWSNYNPYARTTNFLQTPETAKFLKNDHDKYQILTVEPYVKWNEIFLNKGWQDQYQNYQSLLNALNPNLNLIYGIDQLGAYESLLTRRQQLVDSYAKSLFSFENDTDLNISTGSAKFLSAFNVKYLISSYQINNSSWQEDYKYKKDNNSPSFFIYRNKEWLERAYFANSLKPVKTVSELKSILVNVNFNPKEAIVIESDLEIMPPENQTVEVKSWQNTKIEIQTKNNIPGLLVISNSVYPGWKATVNDQKTELLKVNANQLGIFTPAGENTVRLFYRPISLLIGSSISIISFIIILIIVLVNRRFSKV